jgi:hypothetical protein
MCVNHMRTYACGNQVCYQIDGCGRSPYCKSNTKVPDAEVDADCKLIYCEKCKMEYHAEAIAEAEAMKAEQHAEEAAKQARKAKENKK